MDANTPDSGGPEYLIIPAAGLGTRMRSVHSALPKEMLPVGRKPAIQYAVEEGVSAGIKNIIIIINRQKEIIREYFEDEKIVAGLFPDARGVMEEIRKNVTFRFLYQKEPLGESDAIGYAAKAACGRSVAVIHPDDIYFPAPGVLKVLKAVYKRYKKDVLALMEAKKENVDGLGNSGRVNIRQESGDVYRIKEFIPKGGGTFVPRFHGELRSCGMSISGPHIFEYIEKLRSHIRGGEFTNVPVFEAALKDRGLLGCRLPGIFFDIGNPRGYELCSDYVQKMQAHSEIK